MYFYFLSKKDVCADIGGTFILYTLQRAEVPRPCDRQVREVTKAKSAHVQHQKLRSFMR